MQRETESLIAHQPPTCHTSWGSPTLRLARLASRCRFFVGLLLKTISTPRHYFHLKTMISVGMRYYAPNPQAGRTCSCGRAHSYSLLLSYCYLLQWNLTSTATQVEHRLQFWLQIKLQLTLQRSGVSPPVPWFQLELEPHLQPAYAPAQWNFTSSLARVHSSPLATFTSSRQLASPPQPHLASPPGPVLLTEKMTTHTQPKSGSA